MNPPTSVANLIATRERAVQDELELGETLIWQSCAANRRTRFRTIAGAKHLRCLADYTMAMATRGFEIQAGVE